jgi:hypothetical protein
MSAMAHGEDYLRQGARVWVKKLAEWEMKNAAADLVSLRPMLRVSSSMRLHIVADVIAATAR